MYACYSIFQIILNRDKNKPICNDCNVGPPDATSGPVCIDCNIDTTTKTPRVAKPEFGPNCYCIGEECFNCDVGK